MGQNFAVVNRLFFGFGENQVLTGLAHSADFILSAANFVAEIVGGFTTGHASTASHREGSRATEKVKADVFEFRIHSFTFHGNKVSEKSASVNEFFRKNAQKNRTKKLDRNLEGWV